MHKSWGNAIDFDDAAERMGVDVMRWLFANARPEDNINFGWHAADESRRELLVLWNVYSLWSCPLVHDFCPFLVLFYGPGMGILRAKK